MGLFGFGKKKENKAEINTIKNPTFPEIPQNNSIPPLKEMPKTEILAPKHVDDLDAPILKDSTKFEELELPELEFPEIPKEKTQNDFSLPEIEEKTPTTLPPIEDKEIGDIEPFKEPELKEKKPPKEKPDLKKKVKTILESKIKPELKYEEIPEPNIIKDEQGPIFIDMPNFKKIIQSFEDSQGNIKKATEKFQKIVEIKNKEDSKIDEIQSSFENAQRKLVFMDKIIFEKQEG